MHPDIDESSLTPEPVTDDVDGQTMSGGNHTWATGVDILSNLPPLHLFNEPCMKVGAPEPCGDCPPCKARAVRAEEREAARIDALSRTPVGDIPTRDREDRAAVFQRDTRDHFLRLAFGGER